MDRRRTDRRRQMEMVLASIFLAARTFQNTWNCRTQFLSPIPNDRNGLPSVKGPKVPYRTLIGHEHHNEINDLADADNHLIGPKVSPAAQLRPVKGLEASRLGDCVPADAVGGSQGNVFCANPVNGIPGSRTKEIISGQDLFFGLLLQAVDNLARGVLGYLEQAELKERDIWLQQDLRLAQQVVAFAIEGSSDPYTFAFIKLYAIHPSKVVSWWRDRKKLLFLAEATNCPTPLLVAKQAEEVFRTMIPDYDYSQVSPVLPLPPPRAHPANTPAPVRGDKEIL